MDVGGRVPRADVALAAERRHGDGVFQLVLGEVVRNATVHVALRDETSTGVRGRGRTRVLLKKNIDGRRALLRGTAHIDCILTIDLFSLKLLTSLN